jgi:hypothetical protein
VDVMRQDLAARRPPKSAARYLSRGQPSSRPLAQ